MPLKELIYAIHWTKGGVKPVQELRNAKEEIQRMIKASEPVNDYHRMSDGIQHTPLTYAATVNCHQIVYDLIKAGAYVHRRSIRPSGEGETAAEIATSSGYHEFLKALKTAVEQCKDKDASKSVVEEKKAQSPAPARPPNP